jgi:hypothetical protein
VYNHTQGSLLLTMLAHASLNTAAGFLFLLFPSLSTSALFLYAAGIFGAVALLLLLATRGQLGYQRYQRVSTVPAFPLVAEQAPVVASQPKAEEAKREVTP